MREPTAEAVAGAQGVVKLTVPAGVDAHSLDAVLTAPLSTQARVLMCEVADDEQCSAVSDLLEGRGFVEEGRVPDYYADGVALRILVRVGLQSTE